MEKQMVIILDFGGQYNQLIARRVREQKVYCEVLSYQTPLEEIKKKNPKGIIFTGGPNSAYAPGAPGCDPALFQWGIPILGICYGAQLMAHELGGRVASAEVSEYGKTITHFAQSLLFQGMKEESVTWMSHTDKIYDLPQGFQIIAHSQSCPVAAMEWKEKNLYGVQFHPEVLHCEEGTQVLHNFLYPICGCAGDWTMENYKDVLIEQMKEKVGKKQVLLALSGGVDSSVAAALLSKAVGNQLTCVFVDHGLMRYQEGDEIEAYFSKVDLKFKRINAGPRFFEKLQGVTEPEAKRKAIGEEFVRVFEEIGKEVKSVDFLAQGTIYPDIVESGLGDSAVIKSHHNVGGLPEFIKFEGIVEPLRLLFKDEVRKLGQALGLPDEMVFRQPFPGPGLGIRIIGEVTPEKVELLQKADFIYRDEIAKQGLSQEISQYFAVLTSCKSVGVQGDERTYEYTLALRAVKTDDFMTADFVKIPYDILEGISVRLINEVKGINRVVYDITTKPPATIEWE